MAVSRECPLMLAGLKKLAALCDKPHRYRGALSFVRSEAGLAFALVEYVHGGGPPFKARSGWKSTPQTWQKNPAPFLRHAPVCTASSSGSATWPAPAGRA